MNTFTNKTDVNNLHIAQVRFGGDVGLQPRTQRSAEEIPERGKDDCDGDQPDPPKGGFGSSERRPGKGRGENRRGDEVGTASGVDGESTFTGIESGEGFVGRGLYLVSFEVAEQEKARRVGMSRHGLMRMCARQHVERGMFERVVSPCFEDEGKVEEHVMIIHATRDGCHAEYGMSSCSFNQNLHKLSCIFTQIGDNMTKTFEVIMNEENRANGKSHMPKDSFLFEKVVPAALILMGIVTLGLILFAAGVLLGIVRF